MAKLNSTSVITTGDASTANKRNASGDRGDQAQVSTPDYSGEVLLHQITSETAFYSKYHEFYIVRPVDPNVAAIIASKMITACNNPNIGYKYGGSGDMMCYGGSNTVSTTKKCWVDCAGLVCECVSEATGKKVASPTATLITTLLGIKIGSEAAFMGGDKKFSSYSKTPVYNGDVLVKPGSHAAIVVAGNPREGVEDEILSGGGYYSGNADYVNAYRLTSEVEYNFEPRVGEPDPSDEGYHYYTESAGYGQGPVGAYAWGRFSEICHSTCDLAKGPPKKWFLYTEDKYQRGMAPSLGAVMCYTNIKDAGSPGLASIVEVVNAEYLYVSQASPTHGGFEYIKRVKKKGTWDLDLDKDGVAEYIFQGFIYNPYVTESSAKKSTLQKFIDTAKDQEGKDGTFTETYAGVKTKNFGWSASFIVACATVAGGLVNVIIPDVKGCSSFGTVGVGSDMGVWFKGPIEKGNPHPQVGDIALFRTQGYKRISIYSADRAGIVVQVQSSEASLSANGKNYKYAFWVIEGDVGGVVKRRKYYTTSNDFCGLFRPNWEAVDGTTEIVRWATSTVGMYEEGTSAEDVAIRDISYAVYEDKAYKPSIKKTGITLSAINYTGMLANLYSVLAEVTNSAMTEPDLVADFWSSTALSEFRIDIEAQTDGYGNSYSTGVDVDLSNIPDVVTTKDGKAIDSGYKYGKMTVSKGRNIYNCLYAGLNNDAAVVGIMANMWRESHWSPGSVNASDGGSGLIQWTNVGSAHRADWMKAYCGANWASNISGQIEYLLSEGSRPGLGALKTCLDKVKQVSNNQSGAETACKLFFHTYEYGKQVGTAYSSSELSELTIRVHFAICAWKLFKG